MTRLICEACGWHIDDVGMRPVCPECRAKLLLWTGSQEEIEQKTEEPIAQIKRELEHAEK